MLCLLYYNIYLRYPCHAEIITKIEIDSFGQKLNIISSTRFDGVVTLSNLWITLKYYNDLHELEYMKENSTWSSAVHLMQENNVALHILVHSNLHVYKWIKTSKIMYQIFLKKYKISQQQENTYKLDNNFKIKCTSEILYKLHGQENWNVHWRFFSRTYKLHILWRKGE